MVVCICGYASQTESDLRPHFIECHRLSYGLDYTASDAVPVEEHLPEQASAA